MNDARSAADAATPGSTVRRLMRAQPTAAIGVTLPDSGWPYSSLVLVAADHDASPVLLISTLAEHTKALLRDSRVSLLFDGTVGLANRLTGARASVLGRAEVSDEPRLRRRFLARHPEAAMYADFGDFSVYRVAVERVHLVAGFGRIRWLDAAEVLRPLPADAPLAEQEAAIVAHMNDEHTDAVQLYAETLLGLGGGDWRMTGVDAEGADLRRGGETGRLDFARPVADAEAARAELVRLVKEARRRQQGAA